MSTNSLYKIVTSEIPRSRLNEQLIISNRDNKINIKMIKTFINSILHSDNIRVIYYDYIVNVDGVGTCSVFDIYTDSFKHFTINIEHVAQTRISPITKVITVDTDRNLHKCISSVAKIILPKIKVPMKWRETQIYIDKHDIYKLYEVYDDMVKKYDDLLIKNNPYPILRALYNYYVKNNDNTNDIDNYIMTKVFSDYSRYKDKVMKSCVYIIYI